MFGLQFIDYVAKVQRVNIFNSPPVYVDLIWVLFLLTNIIQVSAILSRPKYLFHRLLPRKSFNYQVYCFFSHKTLCSAFPEPNCLCLLSVLFSHSGNMLCSSPQSWKAKVTRWVGAGVIMTLVWVLHNKCCICSTSAWDLQILLCESNMSEYTAVSFFGLFTVLWVSQQLWLLHCGDYHQEGLHTRHAASTIDPHQCSFPSVYPHWFGKMLSPTVLIGKVTLEVGAMQTHLSPHNC